MTPTLYDNFAAGFIRADETLKLTDKSPHHLLIITNERMFSHYPLEESTKIPDTRSPRTAQ